MVAAYFYDQLHERTKAVSANRITPWIWLGRLKKFFRFGYVFQTPNNQGCALVEMFWNDVYDVHRPSGCPASCLFDNKG